MLATVRSRGLRRSWRLQASRLSSFSQVFTWGHGDSGELGHGIGPKEGLRRTYEELVPKDLGFFHSKNVRALNFGRAHGAAVTESGQLYIWGSNDEHQCGLEDPSSGEKTHSQTIVTEPTRVKALDHVHIVDVHCSDYATAALDREGRVWTWGWGGSFFSGISGLGHGTRDAQTRPKIVKTFTEQGVRMKQYQMGEMHAVALSDDGEVWASGNGEYGRMGNGGTASFDVPEPMECFADMHCTSVAAGHAFGLALSVEGRVYSWGKNEFGQLGHGGSITMDVYSMENYPKEIEAFQNIKISGIAAGHGHAAAVSEDGRLFMWGMKTWLEPHEMTAVADHHIVQVACGNNFTAALSKDGKVFTFGKGRSSALGHGDRKTKPQPTEVEFLSSSFVTSAVTCGDRCMGAIVEPKSAADRDFSLRE